MPPMTYLEYRKEREKRGARRIVAPILGISPVTLWARETGKTTLKKEHIIALLTIPEKTHRYKLTKI